MWLEPSVLKIKVNSCRAWKGFCHLFAFDAVWNADTLWQSLNFPRYTHSHRAGCLFDPSSYIRPISQVEVAGVDSSVISSNFKCSEMSEMKYSIPYYDLWFKFLSFQNDKENIFILGVSHFSTIREKQSGNMRVELC